MRWVSGDWLWLIAAVTLIVGVAGGIAAHRRAAALRQAAGQPAQIILSKTKRRLRLAIFWLAAALLCVVLARPYFTTAEIEVANTSRDIVVVFDVSKSMLATDVPPSRLAHAKYLLSALANKRRGDAFALVAFAGDAFLACPFTSDPEVFASYVDELSPRMVPRGGTNIEKALDTAMASFRGAEGNRRAIVLFSDGDELTGDGASRLKRLKDGNTMLHVVAIVGVNPAPLPDEAGRLRRDKEGKIITSGVNEALLKRLADATGGVYCRPEAQERIPEAVDRALDALDFSAGIKRKSVIPEDEFPVPLGFALAAVVLWLIISERPACLLLLLSCIALRGGEVSPEASFNAAVRCQREGKDEAAVKIYEELLKNPAASPVVRTSCCFNLAETLHRSGREDKGKNPAGIKTAVEKLEAAKELYRRGLSLDGAGTLSERYRHNLEQLDLDLREAKQKQKEQEEKQKEQEKKEQQQQQKQQQKKQDKDQPDKNQPRQDKSKPEDKTPENNPPRQSGEEKKPQPQPKPEPAKKEKEQKSGDRRALQLLHDEAQEFRKRLQNRGRAVQPAEKDW